jgi:hypothetical protein
VTEQLREEPLGPRLASAARRAMAGLAPFSGAGRTNVLVEDRDAGRWLTAFVDEAGRFHEERTSVLGLSTGPFDPPEGSLGVPFPIRIAPPDLLSPSRDALQAIWILFPDGTGVRLLGEGEGHLAVRQALEVIARRRLRGYREALLEARAIQAGAPEARLSEGPVPPGFQRLYLGRSFLVRLGPPEAIRAQVAVMRRANAALRRRGFPGVFPEVAASVDTEDPGWYLLEDLGLPVERLLMDGGGDDIVARAVAALSSLHLVTRRLAGGWIPPLLGARVVGAEPHLLRAIGRLVLSDLEPARLLRSRVRLPDGSVCRSFEEHTRWLREQPPLPLATVSTLHGDPRPELALADGGSVRFVDPVVAPAPEGGPLEGDPAADVAALLTRVTLLRAVRGRPDALLDLEEEAEGALLVVSSDPGWSWPVDPLFARFTLGRGESWPARLHLAAASTLAEVLGRVRPLGGAAGWLVPYVGLLVHLERARQAWPRS